MSVCDVTSVLWRRRRSGREGEERAKETVKKKRKERLTSSPSHGS